MEDILYYIYETAVGKESNFYERKNERFVKLMEQFGLEIVHGIYRGCARYFALILGDSDALKGYEFWDDGDRDAKNLMKEEFLEKLDYILLLYAKLQLPDCEYPDEKEEFLKVIKNFENDHFLNKVVQNDLEIALKDQELIDNSWSIYYNAKELKSKFEAIEDDVTYFIY